MASTPKSSAPTSKDSDVEQGSMEKQNTSKFIELFLNYSQKEQIQGIKKIEASVEAYRQLFLDLAQRELPEAVRATLVKSFGKVARAEDIPKLAKFLADPDKRVRANAIEGLELTEHPGAYPYITHFLGDEDPRIRANVVKALKRFGKQNLDEMLDEMLFSDERWMRNSAAYCLAVMAREEHLPLLERSSTDPDKGVRRKIKAALERLAREGSEKARELFDTFSEDTQSFHIEEDSSFAILSDGTLDLDQLFDARANVRAAEISRIAQRGDQKYLPLLFECFEKEETEIVCKTLLDAICKLEPRDAVNRLSNKLHCEKPSIVKMTISSIFKLDSSAAAPIIVSLMAHKDEAVARHAFEEICKNEPEIVDKQMRTMLNSPNLEQRKRGICFLEQMTKKELPKDFEEFLLRRIEKEDIQDFVPILVRAFAACASSASLDDYFNLKGQLSKELDGASSLKKEKLSCLESAKQVLAKRLNLSPEELGTMEGTVDKLNIERERQKQASPSKDLEVCEAKEQNRWRGVLPIASLLILCSLGFIFKDKLSLGFRTEQSRDRKRKASTALAKPQNSALGSIGSEVDLRCVVKRVRKASKTIICKKSSKRLLLGAEFENKDLSRFKPGDEVRLKGIIKGIGNSPRAIILKGTLIRHLL